MSFFNPLLSGSWGSPPRPVPAGTFAAKDKEPAADWRQDWLNEDSRVFQLGKVALPKGVVPECVSRDP